MVTMVKLCAKDERDVYVNTTHNFKHRIILHMFLKSQLHLN